MSANLESPAGVTTDGPLVRVERRGSVLHTVRQFESAAGSD
jgi:hypothetical protein